MYISQNVLSLTPLQPLQLAHLDWGWFCSSIHELTPEMDPAKNVRGGHNSCFNLCVFV
mgnify:CR=1 FL=1